MLTMMLVGETGAKPRDEKRDLVCRVAGSACFKRTARLRALLLFVAERDLQAPGEDLHEQEIGCRVFGKAEGYDTSNDNIVRVSASLLRKRLDEYFATEGKNEPVVIRIPKGTYQTVFEPRDEPAAAVAEQVEPLEPEPAARERQPDAVAVAAPVPRSNHTLLIICFAVAVVAIAAGFWLLQRGPGIVASSTPALARFWSGVLGKHEYAAVVVADASVTYIEDITQHSITLDQYVRHEFLPGFPPGDRRASDFATLMRRPLTTVADVALFKRILDATAGGANRLQMRYCRDLSMRDFKANSVLVLLGSKRGNPWAGLFEPQMNFRFEFDDPAGRAKIRNHSPAPGEQSVYVRDGESGTTNEVYSVIAFLPNLDGTGNVLLLYGTAMEGTEAAGDYVTDESSCAHLLKRLGIEKGGAIRPFEALLRSTRIGGVPRGTELIAYRLR